MGLRLFTEETGWEQARRDVRYTIASLAALPEHARLARGARELLDAWNAIDQERRDAEDARVDANALVAALDSRLDTLVNELIAQLRYEYKNNDHPVFRRYFPEAPFEIIRMGLESEIERIKHFRVVADETHASRPVRAILERMSEVERAGKAALKTRERVIETLARVGLKIQTWKENANAARRSIENQLDTYAIANNLPRDYADTFFPPSTRLRRPAAKKTARGDNDVGGEKPTT